MQEVLILVLLGMGFVSFIPVMGMIRNNDNKKYRCLKYLINVAFVWTILIFIERLSSNITIIYYAHMLGYPLKFLLAATMVCTIFNYVEKKMPKWVLYVLGLLFFVEFLIGVTNRETQFLLEAKPSTITGFADLYTSLNGPIFIYHLLLTYFTLLVGVGYLFAFLAKHKNVRQYRAITQTMAISVVVVILFNALQLLVVDTNVDLTYVSLIVVSFALYQVIYRQDMVFNLKSSGRGEILSNMREMYILTDSNKIVIEVSELLQQKYQLLEMEYVGKSLDDLIKDLEKNVIFYKEYNVDGDESVGKDHFHLREKKFTLKGMNDFGYMILLYDETQVFGLLRELNKMSNYDNMTGLNNRNYIEHKLEGISSTKSMGVISLDLNGLKANNDYLGHERGDFLLKGLANVMKEVLKDVENRDMARIGGDEFLVILNKTTLEDAIEIKNKVLEQCFNIDLEQFISVSVGVAYDENGSSSIYQLIQEADKDMYEMKKGTSTEYSKKIVAYAQKMDKYIR
jgi:diguanylate cyclase (GGDEF)-like protein